LHFFYILCIILNAQHSENTELNRKMNDEVDSD
jgi:hypothetical protein